MRLYQTVIRLLPSGRWNVICTAIWLTGGILPYYTALKKSIRRKRTVSKAKMRYLYKNCSGELWEQLKSIKWNYVFQVITRINKDFYFKGKKGKLKASFSEKWVLGCVPHTDRVRHWQSNPNALMHFAFSDLNKFSISLQLAFKMNALNFWLNCPGLQSRSILKLLG